MRRALVVLLLLAAMWRCGYLHRHSGHEYRVTQEEILEQWKEEGDSDCDIFNSQDRERCGLRHNLAL